MGIGRNHGDVGEKAEWGGVGGMGGRGKMGWRHGAGVGSRMGGWREICTHGLDASGMGDSAVEKKVSREANRWDRLLLREREGREAVGWGAEWAGEAGP